MSVKILISLFFVSQYTNLRNEEGDRPLTFQDLGYKQWDSSDFPGINEKSIEQIRNSNMQCPKSKNFTVSGNYALDTYTFISIQ